MRKIFPHPLLSAVLLLFWVLLVNSASLGSLVMAAILATVVPLLTSPYWPEQPALRRPIALLGYFALVIWDVVVANIQVAIMILFKPADQFQSAWILVPIDLPSAEAKALLAGTITMTPGTLTADFAADGTALLVHSLHAPDPDAVRDDIKSRYESRLQRIFG